jgi:Glycosyl transferase family 2
MKFSVIICTHNPRPDYLRRVLDALRAQTLPKEQWELLLIDNSSEAPLELDWDLSWHPHGRIVREDELGLTPARLRGIKESTGDLLIFVDDDNVLGEDYLHEAASINQQYPMIAAFGAGSSRGEFEIGPPDWIRPYLEGMAVAEIDHDCWSNQYEWSLAFPFGAGMCVRRAVAEEFSRSLANGSELRRLGRTGKDLLSGEDIALASCAIDLGFGTGRFKRLKLTHLIPAQRLTEDYIVRLQVGIRTSNEILAAGRGKPRIVALSGRFRDWLKLGWLLLEADAIGRKILLATWRTPRLHNKSVTNEPE